MKIVSGEKKEIRLVIPKETGEQTCPEIRNLSRNKGLFLGYGAIWGDGISGRVFLERAAGRAGGRASKGKQNYFWTRLLISGRVFLERAAGRAGGRGL